MRLELSNKIEIKNGKAHYTGVIIDGETETDISSSVKKLASREATVTRIVVKAQAQFALYKKQKQAGKFWYLPENNIFKRRENEDS